VATNDMDYWINAYDWWMIMGCKRIIIFIQIIGQPWDSNKIVINPILQTIMGESNELALFKDNQNLENTSSRTI
jgi:hypothetical protein